MRTVEEHQAVVAGLLSPLAEESVPLAAAHGRVLARDVPATVALPGFDNSAMDGYAARWAEIASAAQAPVRLPGRRGHPGRAYRRRPAGAGHRAPDHDRRAPPARRGRRRPGRAHRRRHRGRGDPGRAPDPAATSALAGEDIAAGAVALHGGRPRSAPPSSAWPPPSASPPCRCAGSRACSSCPPAASSSRPASRCSPGRSTSRTRGCSSPRWRTPAARPAGCTSSPTTSASSSRRCAPSWRRPTC